MIENLKNNVDSSWYHPNRINTISKPNFFSFDQVNVIKKGYYDCVNKLANFVNKDPSLIRITELKCDPKIINSVNQAINLTSNSKAQDSWEIYIAYADDEAPFHYLKNNKEFYEFFNNINLNWLVDCAIWLNTGFHSLNRPGKVYRMAIQNFFEGFEIHCDGEDVDCKTKTRQELDVLKNLKKEDYKFSSERKYVQQGLVTIQNDNVDVNGTVIFNQWFPYSVYWDYANSINEKFSRNNRQATSFRKGEPLIRFGQEFKNVDLKPIDEESFKRVILNLEKTNLNVDDVSWVKEAMYGLSIDQILMFDQPGKLNSWDNRTLHMTKPFNIRNRIGNNAEQRITLQYETIEETNFQGYNV